MGKYCQDIIVLYYTGKIMVLRGTSGGSRSNMVEILDLKNQSFSCNGVPEYPIKDLEWTAGGLVEGNVPLVCGGQIYYKRS